LGEIPVQPRQVLRLTVIIALLLSAVAAAQAACVLRPDGPESRYVENGAAYALCLQRELADALEDDAIRARMDADLRAMRLEFERRQRELASRLVL
jgi:hypothetical protein